MTGPEQNRGGQQDSLVSPDCKIIILTQNEGDDLMTAALHAGALAFVLKAEMTTELVPAVQAASPGKVFRTPSI